MKRINQFADKIAEQRLQERMQEPGQGPENGDENSENFQPKEKRGMTDFSKTFHTSLLPNVSLCRNETALYFVHLHRLLGIAIINGS